MPFGFASRPFVARPLTAVELAEQADARRRAAERTAARFATTYDTSEARLLEAQGVTQAPSPYRDDEIARTARRALFGDDAA